MYSNTRLTGTWIGTYSLSHEEDSWASGNEIIFKSSPFKMEIYEPFISEDFHSVSNLLFGDFLITKTEENDFQISRINFHSNDSLSFIEKKKSLSFRKVHDSLKQTGEIKFVGGLFESKSVKNLDTIYFTEKYLLIKNEKWEEYDWTINRYRFKIVNDIHFIFTQSGLRFMIQKKQEKLFLYKYWRDSLTTITLNEIIPNEMLQKQITSLKNQIQKRDSILRLDGITP